ncbi:F-box associated interaction domain-containing protein [Artemisia annua]|uniref:F-box associated interaction domain-containing protein n=1 Tax=Artemisia annua TaxID=35608 RepID=A0A2U1NTL6_ARTAN|nr:F-box associated interaction domain-containing protein [Artemisia annua]
MDVQVPTLLPEIIFHILLLLPVHSLFRCKSVCKDWYKLITNETFVKAHLAKKNKCLFYKKKDVLHTCSVNELLLHNPMSKTSINYPLIVDDFARLVGSANGLLCIVQLQGISIYNPTTRICNRVYGGFVAPVRHYQVAYGFGYESHTDDYKVVAVCKTNNKVKVYSLKTGIWKKVTDFPDANLLQDGLFLDGSIYWLDYLPNNLPNIVSFDLLKETYSQVTHPPYDEGEKRLDLGVLEDRLCILSSYAEKALTNIWVVDGNDSWTNSLFIMYPQDHDGWARFCQTYCISNYGKILLQFGYRICIYDLNNSSLTFINDIDDCQWVCSFDESLVSPIGPGLRYRLRSWKVKSRMGDGSSIAI